MISSDYEFSNAEGDHTREYLWDPILAEIRAAKIARVFDLGCGNGAFVRHLRGLGIDACGVDPSIQGIQQAKMHDATLPVANGNGYEPLSERFGQFPFVTCMEVMAHVYYPRKMAKTIFDLLEKDGIAIVSTPYHGYFKNCMLAAFDRFDQHLSPLWENGVIKFWSIKTMTVLFQEIGLEVERVHRVGRIPWLAKSMIFVLRKN